MNIPADFGPMYAETDFSRFPVEPWNTFSNIIFLFVIIYFARATKCNGKKYPLTVVALPLLVVGFVGGTVFHATRSHPAWLIMDWGPIVILCVLTSIYFLRLLTKSLVQAVTVPIVAFIGIRFLLQYVPLPIGVRISVGYSCLALMILLPAYFVARIHVRNRIFLLYAAFSFIAAILCRYADRLYLIPMGTHFMWHVFGGISVWFLMAYITSLEETLSDVNAVNRILR